jgi:hypothetical protein
MLTCRAHGVPFPRQLDLFDRLIGLPVVMRHDRGHGTHAFIGRNRALCCTWCGEGRGQVSEAGADLIQRFVDEFGTLDVPFTLVNSVSPHQEED